MTAPYFVADSASVTVLRSLASTAFGKYNLTLPDGVDLEDVYEVSAEGNELAYVASLGARRRVGGMFRRFVRADVNVTAEGEDIVPATDVERVLNDAEKRVSGDFFLESDITRAGLGPWTPFVDFHVGDIANVEIWGRVVPLAVTRIEPKRTEHSDNDWSVHVGGQLLSDAEARLAENADIYNAVVSDRRDLAGLDGKIRAETNNRKAAVRAEREARVADVAQVREVLGGARADEQVLVSQLAAVQAQIRGMVGDGESPPPPGMLNSYLWMNTRLWEQQEEINAVQAEAQEADRKALNALGKAVSLLHLTNYGSWRPTEESDYEFPSFVQMSPPSGCYVARETIDGKSRHVLKVREPGMWQVDALIAFPGMATGTGRFYLHITHHTPGGEQSVLSFGRLDTNEMTGYVTSVLDLSTSDSVEIKVITVSNGLSTLGKDFYSFGSSAKYSQVTMRQLSRAVS